MSIELDLRRHILVIPVLLHVQALVGVVAVVMLTVYGEPVEAVVGVLHVHDVTVVVDVLFPFQDGVVRFSFDRDVRVRGPAIK